jgi:putative ABC transport system permease protein
VRRIAEWAVVGLAAAAVMLILVADPESRGASPLLVLLPVLLAGAGCVLALHLTPVLLRLVGRTARTARGLVPLLGPARAERDPAVGVAPVLAIVVGTAIAVFSSGFLATVGSGTEAAARAAVGGDLRVSAPYFTEEALDSLNGIDGIAATAPVYADTRAPVEFPRTDTKVTVFVIDAAALREVQQGDPAPFPLPPDFDASGGGAVPIVASGTVMELAAGESFDIDGTPVDVVATVAGPSPFGSQGVWVAVDRSRAAELVDEVFSPEVVLVSLEPGADPSAVGAELVELLGTAATVTAPGDLIESRSADPGSAALATGLTAAIAAVAVLLALAIALTLVLASGARGRLFALLGALGLPRRHELALVAWELVPVVLVAVPIGALVGMALTPLVAIALDLTVFTGGAVAPAVSFGGPATAGLVLLILVVSLLAIAAAALIARRTATARVLRTIDEEG